MGVPGHFLLMATLALQNAYLLLHWPSRMHIYDFISPQECIFMAQLALFNEGVPGHFSVVGTIEWQATERSKGASYALKPY